MQRRWHIGLVGFFVVAALAGTGTGLALQQRGVAARTALSLSAVMTALVAFAGVFYHRIIVLRLKQAEVQDYLARIEREHDKLRAVLQGSTDLVMVLDESGRIVETSRLARELLGVPRNSDWRERFGAEDRQRLERTLQAVREGIPGVLDGLHLQVNDGESGQRRIVCDLRAAALEAGGESLLGISLRDVSAQQDMERELQLRKRLSSLGLLTTGVAHEINNPLEGIGNYLSLLSREQIDDESRQRWVAEVSHGFERIRDLVRNLLLFARPEQASGPVDLSRTVNRALAATSSTRRMSGVTVERHGLETPIFVAGEAGRLEQVLINLLLNAGSALEGGGVVRVTAERGASSDGAEEVTVVVEDDGPGVAPDVRDRIFDPFFSTGEGTGMGLAVSYGIVQAHGGSIALDDSALGGARFTIRLPAAAAPKPAATVPTKDPAS